MKLSEKRKAIEVLLCGATIGSASAAMYLEYGRDVARAAANRRARVFKRSTPSFMGAAIEAAYRLIESSPTLRREWFGAP